MQELCFLRATDMAQAIRRRYFSVRELIQAHIDRALRINPFINALVSTQFEQALVQADEADRALARGALPGPLFGLPVAHKDSFLTQGVTTTFGSPLFQSFVPDRDSTVVARQRAAGAILMAKTNMPEFGAGSHTYNDVFGITRNPYSPAHSAGGSSGGAAAALAAGLVALADGTDMGGSLRNPASFCNVVGLRPSLGRVAMSPTALPFNTLTTGGPMGRCVADVALLLDVIAGASPGDPFAHEARRGDFFPLPERDTQGVRIALSPDVGGLPVEAPVRQAFADGIRVLDSLGCVVEEAAPDFSDSDLAFETLRALLFAANYEAHRARHPEQMKETVRWNIDTGLALSGAQVVQAERTRARLYADTAALLQRYDFLVAPVSQVAPFSAETDYPTHVDGIEMPHYIGWMRSCSRLTLTGHPAISLPCAFTADGLPIGIQIVGRYRQERELLAFAQVFERAQPLGARRPALP